MYAYTLMTRAECICKLCFVSKVYQSLTKNEMISFFLNEKHICYLIEYTSRTETYLHFVMVVMCCLIIDIKKIGFRITVILSR